ncbi:hypothetical protein WA026_006469 [Henosepilachna vigintioctopunctata]|uniref:Uncharacterized protein n=1 Tax=Henosepilachna vigintioctopunctata TaxID=420089 RepID=A0AAW1UE31_9CUCU
MKSPRDTKERKKMDLLDSNLAELMTHHKKLPHLKQKSHKRKKTLRRRPSSMIRINSSAELKKMLIEKRSSPSFTLSNTGDYFRTFLRHQNPRTLLTYYQTSSSSKDNGGDTYDEQYFKNQHIVVATTSNPISPICSGPCGSKRRSPPPLSPCTCTCGTTYEKPRRNQSDESNLNKQKKREFRIQERQDIEDTRAEETQSDKRTQEIQNYDMDDIRAPDNQRDRDDVSIDPGGRRLTKTASVQRQPSSIMRDPELDRPKSQILIRVESQSKSLDTRDIQPSRDLQAPSDTRPTYSRQNLTIDIRNAEVPIQGTIEDAQTNKHVVCITECGDPCNVKATSICTCCHQPIVPKKPCCACPPEVREPPNLKSKCICDILTCLKEKIRIQTAEQNRNLDQILEELNKQDRELKEIRNFVEKYNDSKRKATNKSSRVRECSCYAVTVQQGFTTDMKPLPATLRQEDVREENSLQDQESKSTEPEIIELFGSNEVFVDEKRPKRILKKSLGKLYGIGIAKSRRFL